MAIITNYTTLQTAIGDYLDRSDLSGFLPNFTQAAEMKIYRRLKIREQETALSGTISSGVLAIPSDYVALKYAYVNDSPVVPLTWMRPSQIYEEYPTRSGGNTPKFISREAGNFIFGPYPADKDIAGIYYARLTALSASNLTNWFTTNATDVLLYGSLLEAAPFLGNDPRLKVWSDLFEQGIKTIQEEQNFEAQSGLAPISRVA